MTSPLQKSAARTAAVQALYVMDVMGHAPEQVVADFQAGHIPDDSEIPADFDKELFSHIVHRAVAMQVDIDTAITQHLDKSWPLPRLEKILRALLRAGAGELLVGEVDAPIIINDYVNVAHGFFSGKEPAMANAVLDKIAASRKA